MSTLAVARSPARFTTSSTTRRYPGSGVEAAAFWQGLGALIRDLAPRNKQLLERRDDLQRQIDAWHVERRGKPVDDSAYLAFLRSIGYLQAEPPGFSITTGRVDPEISSIAGPQLVVPVTMHALRTERTANRAGGALHVRFTAPTPSPRTAAPPGGGATTRCAARVIAKARQILDQTMPLAIGSHRDATTYAVDDGQLVVTLKDHAVTGLARPEQFVGYRGEPGNPRRSC